MKFKANSPKQVDVCDVIISSSMSLQNEWLGVAENLKDLGITVGYPSLDDGFDWSGATELEHIQRRQFLLEEHFAKMQKARCLLVYNGRKNNVDGYIGPSTLLEIGMAFAIRLPIFLYESPNKNLDNYDEIMSVKPMIINQNLAEIEKFLNKIGENYEN